VRVVSRQRVGRRYNGTVLPVALVVTALDALTKWWARRALAAGARHVVGPLWWRLEYNEGISFSLKGASPWVTTLLTALLAVAVLAVAVRARRGLATYGFALIVGGGVGNVLDRLAATPHRVTDFISVGSFAVFNVADASITVGVVLLLLAVVRGQRLVGS
jgi:signal peptidase II